MMTFLVLIAPRGFSQNKTVKHSNQQWVQYYSHLDLSDRWILMIDGGFRWKERFNERLIYIGRVGLGYQLNPKLRLTAGIASTGAYLPTGLNEMEFRPYQELFYSDHYNKIIIHHRLRMEERFFKDVVDGNFSKGHDFNYRFRYQVSVSIPLINFSRENNDRQLSLNVGDEIFINAGKEIVYNILDKNRLVIGPTFQLNKNFNVGISYNFQFLHLNAPATYAHDDVIWLTVRHQMSVSKSKTKN